MADLTRADKRALAEKLLRERASREVRTLPVSYGQRALWMIQQADPRSVAYNAAWSARLRSEIDPALLERCCQALVQRHGALRTTFREAAGDVVQDERGYQAVDFQQVDASSATEEELRRLVIASYREPFDLEHGPLFRARLFSQSPTPNAQSPEPNAQSHVLLLTLHHIICDAWSIWVLVDELTKLYAAGKSGEPSPFPTAAAQYADFISWQREMLSGEQGERLWQGWRDRLSGELPHLDLSAQRPATPSHRRTVAPTHPRTVAPTHPRTLAPSHPRTSDSHFVTLDPALTDALKALAQREGVTLFMLLAAAYQALLHRYTRQSEVVLGSPVSGRSRAEFASTVGYFVNPVALRLETPDRATFTDLLKSAKARVLEALTHQDYPFPLLVERLQPRRDGLRSPIFQTLFVLQIPSDLTWDGVALEPYEIPQMEGQFELGLELIQTRDSLRGILKFDTAVIDASAAARMAGHLETLLQSVASDPTQRVADIPLLAAAEQRQIVEQWNATRVRYDGTPLLHEHIERQALRTPDAVAVSFDGQHLTYRALNAASNRLAHALRRLGVGPDVVVGVSLERSIDLVVSLLAVLKAGGAYLPIDLDYPEERQRFMREDSRCALVLTREMLAGLDLKRESDRNPAVAVDPDNLAYVIYTSGSTGAPKGAMNTHRAICNRLLWMQEAYKLDATDCVLQKTPFSFDVSVWEFFWPLMTGARLAVARPGGHRDSAYLAQTIADEQVTTVHFVPSMLQIFATERGLDRCASLKRVICSGESLPKDLQDRVLSAIPSAELHNLYGPTEAAVDVTAWHCTGEDAARAVPIGRPIANTQVYVLDESMRPAPVGVPGELYLGGVNLARGYVHRPDLTAERFVPNPFAPGTRLYKTGDLCSYRPDGAIEYLGRLDHQVKIRGVRIELGEIEAVLARHPAVREAAVVVDNALGAGGDPRLVGFIVGANTDAAIADVRQFARTHLPESMVPSFLIPLDRLPLLPNGKLDRTALLRQAGTVLLREAHGHQRPSSRQPKSEAERRIAAIWCDLLTRDRVGTDDNFFEIGGHSLLAIRLLRRLEEAFGSPLAVADVFQYPTVAALARRVTSEPAIDQLLPTAHRLLPTAYRLPTGEAVAVIGMSCRFPGASSVDAFWENLRGGVESIARFTDEELTAAGVDAALLKDPAYVRARAVLPAIEYFDAEFFGLSPREAAVLDPQHRLFLECAWETLEDAGYDPSRHGGAIGVYAGAGLNTYLLHNVYQNPDAVRAVGPFQVMIGNDKDYLPTRVSYTLDLRGPSISVQSACSTSLVAIHMAARAVLAGECDMALAGAVSIPVPQVAGYRYQEGMILSPDGHCRPFDARAAGTVGGSGVGVVLLKSLSRALADRDHIVGLIRGTAVNNDGRTKVGYTAPSVEGQQRVIEQALAHAGVSPDSISYLEAHGTGTALGDPIEGRAIARAFAARSEGIPRCVIGSVKSNIGHLDAAAGMAGFIKTLLALHHHAIPPTLHFGRLNPDVELDPARFEVETTLREWPAGEGPRRAGVSSFGIGGTNAHLVVEEAPAAPSPGAKGIPAAGTEGIGQEGIGKESPQLLVLSARTPSALDSAVARLGEHLRVHPELPLADVAHTLQVGRRQFQHRCAVVCETTADASRMLLSPEPASRSAHGRSVRLQPDRVGVPPSLASPKLAEGQRRRVTGVIQDVPAPVTFMFPGQGAQYARMGAGLYDTDMVFRSHVDRCAELLEPHLGLDLRSVLYQQDDEAALRATAIAQPALFVTCYALAQVWLSRGVQPAAFIGHSIGEYVAAALAGVFSLEDALRVVAARGRLLQALPPGSMLAVALSAEAVEPLLNPRLAIAAVNGPASCVVSGESDAIDAFERLVRERGGICHRLHTSHAFHSPMMDAALPAFIDEVARTPLSPPQVPIVSNLTGTWLTAEQAVDPQYWAQHLRRTVRFYDGLRTLLDESCILLEVGPGRTLTGLAGPHVRRDDQQLAVASMRHALDAKADEKTTYVVSGFSRTEDHENEYVVSGFPGAPKLGTSEGGSRTMDNPRGSRTVENADEASLLDAAARLWVAGVNMQWSAFGPAVRRRVSLPTYPFERQRHWIEASGAAASAAPAPIPARAAASELSGIEQWFWLPSWRRAALPAPRDEHPTSWLALIDETGLGADLLRELRVRGDRVIAVTPGDRFARLGHDRYLVRPGERADYDRLVKAIHAEPGELPRGIVHAWSLAEPGTWNVEPGTTNSELGTQNPELRQARVFFSLVFLAQALETVDETRFEVTVLSSRMQAVAGEAVLDPDAALLLGPVRTIPLEYSHIACRSVDVAPGQRMAAIVNELDAFGVDAVVAYRDNQRWVCERAQVPLAPAVPRLHRGGVYLITGGYGGVGLTLAEHLARTYAARLVLIGRAKLDETRRHALNERLGVGRSGAHAIYAAADVTDPRRMREVIAEAMSAFGEINGVIHAAGVAAGGIVQRKTKATVDPILAPKVAGTRVLHDVLQGIPIDFCVLMSSVTGLVGEFGQVDYGAANAFMDAFAHARHREGAPWISIDWDTWSEVGMAATTALPKELEAHRAERLASGIRSAEGVAAFERVLGSGLPQVAVSPRDLRVRIDGLVAGGLQASGAELVAPLVTPHARPALRSTYDAPASETAQELVAIWQVLLGVEPIGVQDDFFELGGHSLLATQMLTRIRDAFGVRLSMSAIFEAPTIAQLAEQVDTARLAEADPETLARILQEIKGLAPE